MLRHFVNEVEEEVKGVEREAAKLVEEVEEEAEELEEEVERLACEVEEKVEGIETEYRAFQIEEQKEIANSIQKALTTVSPEEEKPRRPIVDSEWFQTSVIILTLLNTLQMGLEADHPDWTDIWLVCENVFTAGFAGEMVIKIIVYKCEYFHDQANWLDCFLSVLGIVDCWIMAVVGSSGGVDLQSLSVLRILRLLRLARILKLMRSVRPLLLVIRGVIKAMSTAIYVFALCVFIFYVFAIFVTEHLGKTNNHLYPGYSIDDDVIDEQEFMANYNPYICFGSMLSSMLTLFNMAIFAEWTEIIRPIAFKQPLFLPLFLMFATTVGFGVMNVLIGVIVDVVTAESRRIETDYHEFLKKQKLQTLEKIKGLLKEIDADQDGVINLSELKEAMEGNSQLQELIGDIDLPKGWAASELLDMLDTSGDGNLAYGEFTTSFFRLLDSDDFQQLCIMQSSINQVKRLLGEHASAHQADLASIKAALGISAGAGNRHNAVRQASRASVSEPGEGSTPKNCNPQKLVPEQRSDSGCGEHMAEITKEDSGLSVPNSLANKAASAPMSYSQLQETLSAALMEMKECIHEEFQAIKPNIESDSRSLRMVMRECIHEEIHGIKPALDSVPRSLRAEPAQTGVPSANDYCDRALPAAVDTCPGPAENKMGLFPHSEGLHAAQESTSLASGFRISANPAASAVACYEDREQLGNGHFTALSTVVQPDLRTGYASDFEQVGLLEDHMNEALHLNAIHYTQDVTHDFVFRDATQKLGFEVHWIQDGLPLVGNVVVGGAANIQGMLQGDRLAECNGISTVGKDRQEVLQILAMRPLWLRMLRP